MDYVIFDFDKSIFTYSSEFMKKISYIISDDIAVNMNSFGELAIYPLSKIYPKRKDIYLIVSTIYNKYSSFEKLEKMGYHYINDYIWAPDWLGNEELPSCYPTKTWEDNKYNYDFSNADGPWDYRYQILLSALDNNCCKIMDCGAGNMSLRRLLEKNAKQKYIKYFPVDNIKKYDETIVCDFNTGAFPNIAVDTIFLCGILEYIIFIDDFIRNVCKHCNNVLLTYNTITSNKLSIPERHLFGWKNHLTEGELIILFEKNKFILEREIYTSHEEIYLKFVKKVNVSWRRKWMGN